MSAKISVHVLIGILQSMEDQNIQVNVGFNPSDNVHITFPENEPKQLIELLHGGDEEL